MEIYELIKNIIRVMPLLCLVVVYIYILKNRWYRRVGIMFFAGWFFVASSTCIFWWYCFNYAPNDEIREYVAQKDGAPRLFGTLFGWVFGLILLFILEFTNLLYKGIRIITDRIRLKNA